MTYIAVTVDLVTNLKLLHFVADHLDDASNVEARDCVPNRPSQLNHFVRNIYKEREGALCHGGVFSIRCFISRKIFRNKKLSL